MIEALVVYGGLMLPVGYIWVCEYLNERRWDRHVATTIGMR